MTTDVGPRPVIVVGAGPTGLTMANLLAHDGVRVLLIERNPATVGEPRAVSIDDEALRTVQAFGAAEAVLSHVVLGYGSDYYSVSGRRFLQVKPTTQEFGYPKRNAFRQPIFEAQLVEHLARQPCAEVWFGAELVGVQQDGDRVTVQIRRHDGSMVTASCEYLIAADGARSFVREELGIRLSGSTFRERWLIVDIEDTTDAARDTTVFCNPERPCITLPGPDRTRRFEFMLHDGETDAEVTTAENVARLLRLYSTDDTSPVRRRAVYTFHARVADRWSDGRIFLAGDAAHLSPPFAGQGMNSGIRDAHNLAWKVAAVVRRELGPGLLATYEQERRRHAWEMIQLALRMGYVMMPRSRLKAAAVQSAFRLLGLIPPVRDYFAQMKYKPKPYFREGFLTCDATPPAARRLIGRLLPQPTVDGPEGPRRLDDVLGNGFALLATPGAAPAIFEAIPADFGAPVPMARVAIGANAALAAIPAGVLLVRPDRYAAAFVAASRLPEGLAAVGNLLTSTWAGPAGAVASAR